MAAVIRFRREKTILVIYYNIIHYHKHLSENNINHVQTYTNK